MKSWFWMSYWRVLPWDFCWWFAAHWGIPGRVPAKCVCINVRDLCPYPNCSWNGPCLALSLSECEWSEDVASQNVSYQISEAECYVSHSFSQTIFCRFYPYPLHECRFVSAVTASNNFLWHFEVELGAGNKKCKPILAAGNETRNDNGIKIRKKWSRHASF